MASASGRVRLDGIVAIDGPSGSGKSTVARELAARLCARYLDTGAMYRAVTWAVLQAGIPPEDPAQVGEIARRCRLDVSTDPTAPGIALDGRPVDREIRTAAVTAAVSAVAAVPAVREVLVGLQRRLIESGGIVVEGRDIGTVVAPEATVKVFLTASTGARAGRRGAELGHTAPEQLASTAADLSRRDGLDSARALSPLQPAADAVLLDTTELPVADVISRLVELVRIAAQPAGPG